MSEPKIETDPEPGTALWEEAQDAKPHPSAAIVDAWFFETFHNLGPHLSEQLYNRFHAARDVLKSRLAVAAK